MIPYQTYVTFDVFGLTLRTWGTFIALAFVVGLALARREARERKIDPELITSIVVWMVVASMVFGRAFYVFGNWREFAGQPMSALFIWDGGMGIYGGIIGALLVIVVFSRVKRIPLLRLSDVFAFVLPFGIFIGRIGCHLIGDHIGKKTSFPFAFNVNGEARFETAIIESVFGLLVYLIFDVLKKKNPHRRDGFYTILFLLSYAGFRFFSDFLRADDLAVVDRRVLANLTVSQIASIIILGGVLVFLPKYFRQNNEK